MINLQDKIQKPGWLECLHDLTNMYPSLHVSLPDPLSSTQKDTWIADPEAQHLSWADRPIGLTNWMSLPCLTVSYVLKDQEWPCQVRSTFIWAPSTVCPMVNDNLRPVECVCHTHCTYLSISHCVFTAVLRKIKVFALCLFPETKFLKRLLRCQPKIQNSECITEKTSHKIQCSHSKCTSEAWQQSPPQ